MIDPRIAEAFNARAPFRLDEGTVLVLANVGSHAHGTYVPPSDPAAIDDVDYLMVVVPPESYVSGIKQWEGANFWAGELDVTCYSFQKFVRLLLKSNPNVLSALWLKPQHYHAFSDEWDDVLANRDAFSSLKAYPAFVGYAHSQLKKMTAFDEAVTREWDEAVELITAAGWTVQQIVNDEHREMPRQLSAPQEGAFGSDSERASLITRLANAEVSIKRIHARHFQGYMGEKRKALVRQHGYDTKNAAHLIRLMRTCVEFLQTGRLRVDRTGHDADLLRGIKAGAWALESVHAEADTLFYEAREAKESSALPPEPDIERVDALVRRVHASVFGWRGEPEWDVDVDMAAP